MFVITINCSLILALVEIFGLNQVLFENCQCTVSNYIYQRIESVISHNSDKS